MKAKSSSKSGLFLIELIIAIAFFAVTSAICMQLFVKAHLLSSSSLNINRSVAAANAAATCFKSAGADPQEMAQLLGGDVDADSVRVYYDRSWQQAGEAQDPGYTMTVSFYQDEGLDWAEVVVLRERDGDVIYQLRTARYVG